MIIGFSFSWLFLLFGFLATAGDEMAAVSLWSWLHALDHEHDNDGAVSGVINLFQDFGWAIGPIAAGFLYESIGPSLTITLGALPIIITWAVYYLSLKRRHISAFGPEPVPQKPHRPRHRT